MKLHPSYIADLQTLSPLDNLWLKSSVPMFMDTACVLPVDNPCSLEVITLSDIRFKDNPTLTVIDKNGYELYVTQPILVEDSYGTTDPAPIDTSNTTGYFKRLRVKSTNEDAIAIRTSGDIAADGTIYANTFTTGGQNVTGTKISAWDAHIINTANPHSTTFTQLLSKPTTLSGFGITDGVNSTIQYTNPNWLAGIDASTIKTGTIDLARFPAFPSANTIVCTTIPAMSAGDQLLVAKGTVVIESTTGNTYRYSGAGSVILNASYIQQSDLTPDWAVITNRPTNVSTWTNDAGYLTAASSLAWAKLTGVPSTFAPSAHTHIIGDTTGLQAALDTKLSIASAASTYQVLGAYITLSSVLTGYVVGANQALLATDTILGAFGKIQTQLADKYSSTVSRAANTFLAAPNGSAGVASFRTIVAADIPALDWSKITTGKPTTLAEYGITDAATSGHNHDTAYLGINSNAVSSTKLATARTINGVSFDGTANISIPYANLTGLPTLGTLAAKSTVTWTSDISGIPTGLSQISQPGTHGNIKLGSTIVGGWHGIEFSDAQTTRILINDVAGGNVVGFYDATNGWLMSFNRSKQLVDGWIPWAKLQNVPSTFAPSAHTHLWAHITDKPSTFAPSAHNQAWSTITGTPTTLSGYGITDALVYRTNNSNGASRLYRADDVDKYYIYHAWTSNFSGHNTWRIRAGNDQSDSQTGINTVGVDYADWANNANYAGILKGVSRSSDGGQTIFATSTGNRAAISNGTNSALINRYDYSGWMGFVVGNNAFWGIVQDHGNTASSELSLIGGSDGGSIGFYAGTPTIVTTGSGIGCYQAPKVGSWNNSGLSVIGSLTTSGSIITGNGSTFNGDITATSCAYIRYLRVNKVWSDNLAARIGGDLAVDGITYSTTAQISGNVNAANVTLSGQLTANRIGAALDFGWIDGKTKDATNISNRLDTGWYQNSTPSTANGWPVNGSWWHLMSSTHTNSSNYYALQIAADFYAQDFRIRSTNGNGATAWSTIWTSSNLVDPAKLSANNTFTGVNTFSDQAHYASTKGIKFDNTTTGPLEFKKNGDYGNWEWYQSGSLFSYIDKTSSAWWFSGLNAQTAGIYDLTISSEVIAPKVRFSGITYIAIGSTTVLPVLSVGQVVMIIGNTGGQTSYKPLTSSSQRCIYRLATGAQSSTAAGGNAVNLDMNGSVAFLVGIDASTCQIIC